MEPVMFKCVIPGKVASKKNQRRLIWQRGRPLSLPSVKYSTWENLALPHVIEKRAGIILCDVSARFEFYFKNKGAEIDIDNCLSGPLDLLQKAGIIKNDKQVVRIEAEKYFGHEPRVVIELRQLIAKESA